jgi:ferredoxin
VAVKIHFGELGNSAFIRPIYIRTMLSAIKRTGAVPFLTDANTLYAGTRSDAPHHLTTAIQNGFAFAVVEAPLVIADGLRGKSEEALPVYGKHFESAFIGKEIVQADALISVAHFKGHELSGFGGAIKNVGMGCASRKGKLAMHSTVSPQISAEACIGCGECVDHCSQHALQLKASRAEIDDERCIGCGECILICANKAIEIAWDQEIPVFWKGWWNIPPPCSPRKPAKRCSSTSSPMFRRPATVMRATMLRSSATSASRHRSTRWLWIRPQWIWSMQNPPWPTVRSQSTPLQAQTNSKVFIPRWIGPFNSIMLKKSDWERALMNWFACNERGRYR